MDKTGIYMILLSVIILCVTILSVNFPGAAGRGVPASGSEKAAIKLPTPAYDSTTSVEKAILKRRSLRDYAKKPLELTEVSQLLWASQGITDPRGLRTAPSAGALYPLELYLVAGSVNGLHAGIYKYRPQRHELVMVITGDKRIELCNAALGQPSVRNAAAIFVISGVYERTSIKYGERATRYIHFEVGHAAQNALLQAVSLDLGAVLIGAFRDDAVKLLTRMPHNEEPLYVIPIGKR